MQLRLDSTLQKAELIILINALNVFDIYFIDQSGVSLVAVHYSINEPLKGTAAGQYNYDIRQKTSK